MFGSRSLEQVVLGLGWAGAGLDLADLDDGAGAERAAVLTQQLLDEYKKRKGDWGAYERAFLRLMAERGIAEKLSPEDFATRTAMLCSEATAEHCHRRLVAEYLAERWPAVEIIHL